MKAEEFSSKLEKIMKELVKEATSKASLEELGEEAAELIKKRTRLGYGITEHGGTKKKLAPLTEKYIKYVRPTKATGPTTKSKSNLTLSGDMLDKIGATVTSDNTVSIGFKDDHASDKAKWVSKLRPFNFLSKPEIAQLKKRLEDKLFKRIRELLAK
jgi:hypothetical protein